MNRTAATGSLLRNVVLVLGNCAKTMRSDTGGKRKARVAAYEFGKFGLALRVVTAVPYTAVREVLTKKSDADPFAILIATVSLWYDLWYM